MDYIKRDLERKFLKMNAAFKVILLTGACVKIGLNQEKPYK
jgi:hypothetical protein